MSIIRDLFTGIDGETQDLGRWGGALMLLVGLGLQVYSTVTGKVFDMSGYGVGCGALALGIGGMLKLKETTEPRP